MIYSSFPRRRSHQPRDTVTRSNELMIHDTSNTSLVSNSQPSSQQARVSVAALLLRATIGKQMPEGRIPLGARLRASLAEKKQSDAKDVSALANDKTAGLEKVVLRKEPKADAIAEVSTNGQRHEDVHSHSKFPDHHFVAPTAASLLGQEVQSGKCFTSGGSASPTLPSSNIKDAIRQHVLSCSQQKALSRLPHSRYHEMRNGQVRLRRTVPGFDFVDKFGECGDSRCGCYRLSRPDVRRNFCHTVAQVTQSQLRRLDAARVRYVTVGSGSLLTDFEILCTLEGLGLSIESVVCIDLDYADCVKGDHKDGVIAALEQLGAFLGPSVALYAFGSLDSFNNACALEPHLYGNATTFVHCDAGILDTEKVKAAAVRCLVENGHMFQLANLGMGKGASSNDASAKGASDDHSGLSAESDETNSADQRMRGYWRAQLRESSEVKAWRRLLGSRHSASLSRREMAESCLVPLPAQTICEPPSEAAARHSQAETWLSQSMHDRAAAHHLSLWKVVFEGKKTTMDGRLVPEGARNVVAVRKKPSRSASVVSTRKKGDKVLVAEIKDGWARLSEEDDDWGWQRTLDSSDSIGEAWMLIDATNFGLGVLLECEVNHHVVPVA